MQKDRHGLVNARDHRDENRLDEQQQQLRRWKIGVYNSGGDPAGYGLNKHWRGRHERVHALWLGIQHGIFCLGCCWSLMLLMFAVGVGNLGWMLALGAVMSVEKNVSWGRRLSKPLGVTLLVSALAIALTGASLG